MNAALPRGPLLRAILRTLRLCRTRRDLATLDDHILRDIGLTRAEAQAEAARRPWDANWDAPNHWRD